MSSLRPDQCKWPTQQLLTKFNRKICMIDNRITDLKPVEKYIYLGRGSDGKPLQLGKNGKAREF
jgi:hypothetical protein